MFFQAPMGPIPVNTTWYSFTPTHQVESCYIMLSSLWLHKNFHPECGSFTLSCLAHWQFVFPIFTPSNLGHWGACVDLSAKDSPPGDVQCLQSVKDLMNGEELRGRTGRPFILSDHHRHCGMPKNWLAEGNEHVNEGSICGLEGLKV